MLTQIQLGLGMEPSQVDIRWADQLHYHMLSVLQFHLESYSLGYPHNVVQIMGFKLWGRPTR